MKRLNFRILISLLIALQITMAPMAQAQGPGFQGDLSRFEGATALLDRFIDYAMKVPVAAEGAESDPEQNVKQIYEELGRKLDIQQGIALQITKLGAGDFNLFLLYMLYRYAENKDPKLRAIILLFRDEVRLQIQGELENTKLIEMGPWETIPMNTIYNSTTLLALWAAFEGARFVWTRGRSMSGGIFLKRLEESGVKATRAQKFVRFSKDAGRNPLVWTTALGAAWSTASYYQQAFSTHKLDPTEMFNVAQAELACNFQYQEFDLSTRYEAIVAKPELIESLGQQLITDYELLLADVEEVRTGYPETNALDTKGPHFQKQLADMPKDEDWARLRQDIAAQQKARPGECLEISLFRLKGILTQAYEDLQERMASVTPSPFNDEAAPVTTP